MILTEKVDDTYAIVDPYNPDSTSPYGVRTTLKAGVHGSYIIDRFVVVSLVPVVHIPTTVGAPDDQTTTEVPDRASFVVLFGVLALVAALVVLVTAARTTP